MMAVTEPLARFRAWIADRLGLLIAERQLAWLDELLRVRCGQHGVDAMAYLDGLDEQHGGPELDALAAALTVGETYFFRHAEQFEALRAQVLPALLGARRVGRRLNILSAGCASGEELYSIAMLLREQGLDASWSVSLLGVDLNPLALQAARRGRYASWSLRGMPEALRQRWFRPEGREHVLDPELLAMARFAPLNLHAKAADFWQAGAFDLVFCRNVLMYFSPAAMAAAVARIAGALAPDGYLFLGHAESLRDSLPELELCQSPGCFYYRRRPAQGRQERPLTAPAGAWFETIDRASQRVRQLSDAACAGTDVPAPAMPPPVLAASAMYAQALALLRQERYAAALRLLDAGGLAASQDGELGLLRAVLLVHQGELAQAQALAQALLGQPGSAAAAHCLLGLCAESAGEPARAEHCYRRAVQLDAGFAMPRLHLGLLARRRGADAEMRQALRETLRLLEHEDVSRLLLFGGGFDRRALMNLCRAELRAAGATP